MLTALALHLVLAGLLAQFGPWHPSKPRAPNPAAKLAELELSVDVETGVSARAAPPPTAAPPAAAPASPRLSLRAGPAPAGTPLGPSNAKPSPGGVASPEPEAPAEPDGPALSLDALGVGESNPFLRSPQPVPRAVTPRERGRKRFERELAGEIARANQAAGLGPEGPVLSALEDFTRTGTTPPNSSAVFRCVTDAEGLLVRVELLASSSDPKPWHEVAGQTLGSLQRVRLRIPKTQHGLTFRIRVRSRIELPSGADPGMNVSLLGIPLKHGDGPRSASLRLLDIAPKVEMQKLDLAPGQTLEVPVLKLGSLVALSGDMADIGAHPRRMVRAHLEKLSANDPATDGPATGL